MAQLVLVCHRKALWSLQIAARYHDNQAIAHFNGYFSHLVDLTGYGFYVFISIVWISVSPVI